MSGLSLSRPERKQRCEVTDHRVVKRPWGHYDSVDNGDRFQVKRLVGLPGQPVPPQMRAAVKSDRVPAETVLVLSDNLRQGLDSRVWGPYPAGGVVGVVLFPPWLDSGIAIRRTRGSRLGSSRSSPW